jgi:hypothetical protein
MSAFDWDWRKVKISGTPQNKKQRRQFKTIPYMIEGKGSFCNTAMLFSISNSPTVRSSMAQYARCPPTFAHQINPLA